MNVRLDHHDYPPKTSTWAFVSWLLFCILLWAAGILLCVKLIETLYVR